MKIKKVKKYLSALLVLMMLFNAPAPLVMAVEDNTDEPPSEFLEKWETIVHDTAVDMLEDIFIKCQETYGDQITIPTTEQLNEAVEVAFDTLKEEVSSSDFVLSEEQKDIFVDLSVAYVEYALAANSQTINWNEEQEEAFIDSIAVIAELIIDGEDIVPMSEEQIIEGIETGQIVVPTEDEIIEAFNDAYDSFVQSIDGDIAVPTKEQIMEFVNTTTDTIMQAVGEGQTIEPPADISTYGALSDFYSDLADDIIYGLNYIIMEGGTTDNGYQFIVLSSVAVFAWTYGSFSPVMCVATTGLAVTIWLDYIFAERYNDCLIEAVNVMYIAFVEIPTFIVPIVLLGIYIVQPPQNLTATNVTTTSITVTWDPTTDPILVGGHIDYQVVLDDVSEDIICPDTDDLTYTFTGLQPGTTYEVGVYCINMALQFSPKVTLQVTTLPVTPDAPTGLTTSNVTQTGATLSWEIPDGEFLMIEDFEDDVYEVTPDYYEGVSRSSEESSDGLYSLKMEDTAEGRSRFAMTFNNQTPWTVSFDYYISGGLSDALAVGITSNGSSEETPLHATLGWETFSLELPVGGTLYFEFYDASVVDSVCYVDNITVSSATYNVYLDGLKKPVDIVGDSYTFTGLEPGTEYTLGVSAKSTSDVYSPVASINVTTVPSEPTGLTVSNITQTGATLSWNEMPGATSYDIYVGSTKVGNTTSATYNVTGLPSGTTSTIGVVAKNSSGSSARTDVQVLTIPTTPTGLTASNISHDSVTLDWTDVSSETGYDVYLDGVKVVNLPAGTTSYIFTELQPNTTYQLGVRSYNDSGYSPIVNISVTTEQIPLEITRITTNFVDSVTYDSQNPFMEIGDFTVELNGAENWNLQVQATPFEQVGGSGITLPSGLKISEATVTGDPGTFNVVMDGTLIDAGSAVTLVSATSANGSYEVNSKLGYDMPKDTQFVDDGQTSASYTSTLTFSLVSAP